MRKSIIIDNYDSFTYNLYQYVSEAFNCRPVVFKNDAIKYEDIDFSEFDFVLLSPGPGHPKNDADFGVCKDLVLKPKIPTIGICLGHQGIILHHGGEIRKINNPTHGIGNVIHHTGKGLFTGIPSPINAIRYHSLHAVAPLPNCFSVEATTESGIVMAVRHKSLPMWGVQFHPESLLTEHGRRIIRNIELLLPPKKQSVKPPPEPVPADAGRPAGRKWRLQTLEYATGMDPQEIFERLFAGSRDSFWLDSNSADKSRNRFSYMGDMSGPRSRSIEYRNAEAWFPIIEEILAGQVAYDPATAFEFKGGLVGYLGYELREILGGEPSRQPDEPKAILRFVDRFLVHDAQAGRVVFCQLFEDAGRESLDRWAAGCIAGLEAAFQPEEPAIDPDMVVEFTLRDDRRGYTEKIRKCMDSINEGESYEICLTTDIGCRAQVDAFPLYKTIRNINPTSYSAFIDHGHFSILCTSPERFFKIQPNGMIETKPIKGTRPRGADEAHDSALVQDLKSNRKDLAENLMVTDMLRNDLNKICKVGSVWSPQHMHVESYRTVHQLMSTIRGTLSNRTRCRDLLQAMFPGGSMTGAPKIRTLEIIDGLEDRPRGVYSGAIGYFSLDGSADFNIVIRTIVKHGDRLNMGVGGAIIALSEPDEEFREILVKGRASMRAVSRHLTGRENAYRITNQADHHHILPH